MSEQEERVKDLKFGTKEWAESNVNCIKGCRNNCHYCYAKKMAIRFKRNTVDTWKEMYVDWDKVNKGYRKRSGRVMFPTTHDIFPDEPYFSACKVVLLKLLKSGNDVLITTKPNPIAIRKLCKALQSFKDHVLFRFTIGSRDSETLEKWEPHAPSFEERYIALVETFKSGFATSISIEPMLDYYPFELVEIIEPYVTDTIWIGKMNHGGINYANSQILDIYTRLKNNKKIRWKESIKKVLIQEGLM